MDNVNILLAEEVFDKINKSFKEIIKEKRKVSPSDTIENSIKFSTFFFDILKHFILHYEDKTNFLCEPYKLKAGINGISSLLRLYTDSYIVRIGSQLFGVTEINESIMRWGKLLRSFSRNCNYLENRYREYTNNLEDAVDIVNSYLPENENTLNNYLVRGYASHKTFTDIEFEQFTSELLENIFLGFEVFITSPIDLYVKLSKDSIIAIIRCLSLPSDLTKSFKLSEDEKLLFFSIHDLISEEYNSGSLKEAINITVETLKSMYDKIVKQERTYRTVTNKENREDFIWKYKNGKLFDKKE